MRGNFDSVAALRAANRELNNPNRDANTMEGAFARVQPVQEALEDWYSAEIARCGPDDATHALLQATSVTLAGIALSMEVNGMRSRSDALAALLRSLKYYAGEHMKDPEGIMTRGRTS